MKRSVRVLRKARELIKEYGWLQGEMGDAERGFCALGAVWEVTETYKHRQFVYQSALNFLRAAVPNPQDDDGRLAVPIYNDGGNRTRGEVLAVFRKAERLAAKA